MTDTAGHRTPHRPLVEPGAIDHHLSDMTATFAADVTLGLAQERLERANQWLPIDGDPAQALGDLVESNSTGPLRLGYGAWRDILLGCQFYNGRRELITAGGRTMKNVAGYDLTKFMVGQHRIYGQIVTLTSRTYRRPEAALLATFEPDASILNRMLVTPARPQWSVLTLDALLCGYLGDARTIGFYESEVPRHGPRELTRRSIENDVVHRAVLWRPKPRDASETLTCRASVPPTRVREFVERAQLASWIADAAFGAVLGSLSSGRRAAVFHAAEQVGGSVTVFDDRGRPINVSHDRAVVALLERLKYAFDPDQRLRPLPTGFT